MVYGCRELGLEEEEPAKPPPHLAFTETAYDFGRVPQGAAVEHVFPFVNSGGSDLSVMNLRAACDCQTTLVGPGTLPPAASGAIKARFDTDTVFGPQRRTVTVFSNDPIASAVTLTLTGEVELDVVADPAQVYLGVVPPGAPLLREVTIRIGTDGVRVGPAQSEAPQLVQQLADAPLDLYAAVLTIGTAPDAPLGPFTTAIRIPTTSRVHPLLRIPVSGIIAADAPTPRPLNGGLATPTVPAGNGVGP